MQGDWACYTRINKMSAILLNPDVKPSEVIEYFTDAGNDPEERLGAYEEMKIKNPAFPLLAMDAELIRVFGEYERHLHVDPDVIADAAMSVQDNISDMGNGDPDGLFSLLEWWAAATDCLAQFPGHAGLLDAISSLDGMLDERDECFTPTQLKKIKADVLGRKGKKYGNVYPGLTIMMRVATQWADPAYRIEGE